ncbi:MAG: iron-sulfur cluster repair di-iron protein [Daejeonella sp.]|uniref:iron-sulfur cluster repair di-iron protein n=1 Tax=Daejeonella sp. TaxID=2805397 RepID=UPI003C73FAEE
MESLDILDVTVIEPSFKHPKIFEKFDSLSSNEAFIIDNDHDPKPLYYQLIGERGSVFTWEYLENGPERWKVKIAKLGDQASSETIGEMVVKDYRKAQVFKKLGIDFCCGGKNTVEEVCKTKGLDLESVKSELDAVSKEEEQNGNDFDKWKLDFLADYIVNTHHEYVRTNVPFITELANKVASVHGKQHTELVRVAEIFNRLGKDLSLHLVKEENIVFPFIKTLLLDEQSGTKTPAAAFDSIQTPTQMMEVEHEQAGEDMAEIRSLTSDYILPADACTSYTVLFKKLQQFENDLFNHVHLENNILFPKAIALEKRLRG